MSVLEDQFCSDDDIPPGRDVSLRYAICSTQRSGSHFLGRLMKGTGRCGDPLEYFNPLNLTDWKKRMSTDGQSDVLSYLESIRSTPNGCFGMKVHYGHLQSMKEYLPLERFLSDFKPIWIRRRDLLRQGISYAKALQTGSFVSGAPEQRPAKFDPNLIFECMASIAAQNASWDLLFATAGSRVLKVDYEDLRRDPSGGVEEIGSFLGLDLRIADEPEGLTVKQSDERNEEWFDHFLRESRSFTAHPQKTDVLRAARRTFFERVWRRIKRTASKRGF
jgi:LPS sulfotransferase NodH